jgi:Flp pilus assembly protein TadG
MVIFGLFLFLIMLIVGGMAVDVMHFETERMRVQATLDRAILAAADMEQTLPPETVVRDFFNKAGLADQLTGVDVTTTLTSRQVAARTRLSTDNVFMRLAGVDALTAQVTGQAEESKSSIEIVLVLDVSSSMTANNRIGNLRTAAANFVQTVLTKDREKRVSIAVVPFDANVNLGPQLRAQYNITSLHGVAGADCVDLPLSAFEVPGIPPTLAMPQTGYFDMRSETLRTSNNPSPIPKPLYGGIYCRIEPADLVRLPSNDMAALQAQVRALKPTLGTSITTGMKWGLAMIDPGTRPVFNNLINDGQMTANLRGRPFNYGQADTLKIIVLMSDGEQTSSPVLKDQFRSGTSPIYVATDGRHSVFHSSKVSTGRPYYVPHLDPSPTVFDSVGWQVRPWNGAAPAASEVYDASATTWPDVRRLAWNEVWSSVQMAWVATQLYTNALGGTWTTHRSSFVTNTDVAAMTRTLAQSCNQARTQGVIVYAINLESPEGAPALQNCASSPGTYIYTTSGNLVGTFEGIAASIGALRLSR